MTYNGLLSVFNVTLRDYPILQSIKKRFDDYFLFDSIFGFRGGYIYILSKLINLRSIDLLFVKVIVKTIVLQNYMSITAFVTNFPVYNYISVLRISLTTPQHSLTNHFFICIQNRS